MKQLSNYVSIKECGNTLGIRVSNIKDMLSKKLISYEMVGGSYMVDVYEVIHYLHNHQTNKIGYLFLNKIICDVIDGLDSDIQHYNLTNENKLNTPIIVNSYRGGKFYCDTFDVDDLMKDENFISKFKKHYYELNFNNNSTPINNYKEKFEISKSLPLMESIEYKVSIILDYFNTYPLLKIIKMFGYMKFPNVYSF